MTDEEKQELRAMMLEAVGASAAAVQKSIRDQLVDIQVDLTLCLERFDGVEVDVRDAKKELERLVEKTSGLVVDMRDVKVHVVKVSR